MKGLYMSSLFVLIALVLGLNAWVFFELSKLRGELRLQGKELSRVSGELKGIKSSLSERKANTGEFRVSVDDDPVKGDMYAPVTVIEFSDYECPFCRRFHEQTLPLIEKEYISKGKVRYVFRDFPLSFHKRAFPAALAANCAGEQGRYWDFNDFLFKNPDKLDDVESIKEYALSLGMDTEKLDRCIREKKYEHEINKDIEDGRKYGIRGTPSFFIGRTENGNEITAIYVRGSQPFQVFKTHIDRFLSESKNEGNTPE